MTVPTLRSTAPVRSIHRRSAAALLAAALVTTLAALTPSPAAAAPDRFEWPLAPRPQVVRAFDKPERNWLPGHRGVDLAGREGQAVVAAGAGVVVFAGSVAGKPVVSVDHPGGLRTTYEPVHARVAAGTRVGRGTVLGYLESGHPGCPAASGTCLHWGLRRDREYLDPTLLVRAVPIRLLPVRTP
ncbi:Peptidase family M23 [Rhodococcus triatomae]|uniref:Peptidase family M23 n=1 Tax=Rhodococcus triatomae TaxID=300028 RepID=A0A1G8Q2T5_9NOCA|nr:Peptidase family M23 [Rhodococcus triatomae]